MNKLVSVLAVTAALALTGCASLVPNVEKARIDTNVKLAEFNSISNQYLAKATFAQVYKIENVTGVSVFYSADAYGSTCNKYGCTTNKLAMSINTSDVPNVMLAIDKYLKWESQAKANKDKISKDIITFNSQYNNALDYTYGFYSGNAVKHFLTVKACSALMGCMGTETEAYLDMTSVLALKADMAKLKANGYTEFNIETKYN